MKLSTEFKNIVRQNEYSESLQPFRKGYREAYNNSETKVSEMAEALLEKLGAVGGYTGEEVEEIQKALKLNPKDFEKYKTYFWLLGDGSWC